MEPGSLEPIRVTYKVEKEKSEKEEWEKWLEIAMPPLIDLLKDLFGNSEPAARPPIIQREAVVVDTRRKNETPLLGREPAVEAMVGMDATVQDSDLVVEGQARPSGR